MKRILLIKLTSFGDLLHTLPALNDAYQADPSICFDWVIDQSFSEIASWHPAVKGLFQTSHRNWLRNLGSFSTYRQMGSLVQQIRKEKYDLVLDAQGNFKSALLALAVGGMRAGFDKRSVREWVAHFAYQIKVKASKQAHAIERLRILFAGAIGYKLPDTAPDFRLKEGCFSKPAIDLPDSYLVFVHSASWRTKLWPEEHWRSLIEKAVRQGFEVLLPWGNLAERERAERLAVVSGARVLERMSLSEMGYVLKQAKGAVCLDTGLSHLAAALRVPSVTLYGATNAELIGTSGQCRLQSKISCAPCNQKSCRFQLDPPPCLAAIQPEAVFDALIKLLDDSSRGLSSIFPLHQRAAFRR